MAVVLSGELTVAGPGLTARFHADGDGPATVVLEGVLAPGRRAVGAIASRAAASGVALTVRDGRGRLLAGVGPDVRSPLGRLVVGTARVRPTARGLLAAARGVAAHSPTRPGDRR